MAEFVFTSPGVKFKERDLSFVTRNVGITTLGLVGETTKGPAFEPIAIADKNEYSSRFGIQSTKRFSNGLLQYQLPYVANAYLEESNQLWVTRVLGLSGYEAGTQWALLLSAGIDPSTEGISNTTSLPHQPFTNNSYMGVSLYATGSTGSTFSGYTKAGNSFTGVKFNFVCTSITGTSGHVDVTKVYMTGTSYTEYENMVLATIRSRAYVQDNINLPPTTIFDAENLAISANTTIIGTGDLFGQFNLVASSTANTETYTVSLNPNSSNFISNVIGSEPKDKNTMIWVQSTYPDLIKKLDADGYAYGVKTTLIKSTSSVYTDYRTKFKTPETPWVVSQLKGSTLDRLFKFISISDGDAANQEIKISIGNIKPDTLEFDVVVRDFYDTDANPSVLETFSRCSMIKGQSNYIAQRIGTYDGEYDLQSKYIMVELADNAPIDAFPAGFEGYYMNNYAMSATSDPTTNGIPAKIFYKTSYTDDDLAKGVRKVYLGISASAYDGNGLVGEGFNQNMFNFIGTGGFVKSKGFHMDSGATGTSYINGNIVIGSFEVGEGQFRTIADVVNTTDTYYALNSRKFTLVPAGGFDGWDVHRGYRTYGDSYRPNAIYDGVSPNQPSYNDYQAWQTAIHTFENPEEVTINVFATPGINWSDQNILVQDAIEMIETQRTDSLYVIDSPDIGLPMVAGEAKLDVQYAEDVAGLMNDSGIDSSYSCTYFPWIQVRDTQNNVNVYIPPTGEVVKAIAFTDNTKFPWFAPAGLQRGVTDARKSKYKLSQEARDILYKARINPMADYADVGNAIFGQKTLQVKESALDRINVRRLLLQVKVLIANIAIRLVFEQNDQTTIDQFLAKATPVLDTIKRERGLYDFRIKMDDSNNTTETRDRNELYGEIFLKPTRAVEYIGITFTITPSGASFADVGA